MDREAMKGLTVKLSPGDRLILESYKSVVEGLADYLGSGYEMVLHSLENLDHSVIKIINGEYTGRKEGAPITDLALEMLMNIQKNESQPYISYFTTNKKGEPLKAATIAIRGIHHNIIGLLCINFYLQTPFVEIVENFHAGKTMDETVLAEHFSTNTNELFAKVCGEIEAEVTADKSISLGRKKREMILRLYQRGYFNMKDSVPLTAKALGISKNTVYMHLRNIHGSQE